MSAPDPRRLRQSIAAALLAVGLLGSAAVVGALAASPLGETVNRAVEGQRFELARWQAEFALNRWLGLVGGLVYEEPRCDAPATLARLAAGIESEDTSEDTAAMQCVERALERAVSGAVSAFGLATRLPLFGSQAVVWPPVDIELERAPRVLAVSPRSEVRLAASVLLSPQLARDGYAGIEAAIEADGEWSAWIGGVGGVATYPALMIPRADWGAALRLAGHEWMHHYLIFYPLGRAYFASDEMRTINETAADIAGDEIGALAAESEVVAGDAAEVEGDAVGDAVGGAADPVAATLRALRLEVDALLADGRVGEAEARMEAGRAELAALGARYRRINQAFFAFRGGYADRADAVSPYGPLLQGLRERSGSLAAFVGAIRGIGSAADAEAALRE